MIPTWPIVFFLHSELQQREEEKERKRKQEVRQQRAELRRRLREEKEREEAERRNQEEKEETEKGVCVSCYGLHCIRTAFVTCCIVVVAFLGSRARKKKKAAMQSMHIHKSLGTRLFKYALSHSLISAVGITASAWVRMLSVLTCSYCGGRGRSGGDKLSKQVHL